MSKFSLTSVSAAFLPSTVKVEDLKVLKTFVKGSGKRNDSPRANIILFSIAASIGIRSDVAEFINPNRRGRGGIGDYISERTGCKALLVEHKGSKYFVIEEKDNRDYYIDRAKGRNDNISEIKTRIVNDFEDVRVLGYGDGSDRPAPAERKARREAAKAAKA